MVRMLRCRGRQSHSWLCFVLPKIRSSHTSESLWLGDVYVIEDQRRDGIGQALMATVQARAAELGCTAIDFELARGNRAARLFYEHLNGTVYEAVEPWGVTNVTASCW
jgi:GNAT superfamily N-acetyltransferase